MMIAYTPESCVYETWREDGQGTSSLQEEAKASHLLTKKLVQMVDREEVEEHTHARPPSPSPSVGSAVPHTPECPPSRSPSPSGSTSKPHHRSLSQSSSSSSDSSEPPHHMWTLNQRARTTTRLTLKEAQTQAVTQAMKRMKAPLAVTVRTGTQKVSPTARLWTLAASPKGQAAVQAAALTAPAPNQKTRRRNLPQPVKCPEKLMQTLLKLACCQRSKALTQRRNGG